MRKRREIRVIARRDVVVGAGTAALLLALFRDAAKAQQTKQPPQTLGGFDEALKKILGDAKPADGKPIIVDLPEIAENGNTVPFTISVDSPMTEATHIRTVHILATGNPQAGIATFSFTPMSGRAYVQSRMRLARTQQVVVVAENSAGGFLLARRAVKVTIGGCGG